MDLKVIGSGSSGNCYLLDDGKQILVIEAGVPFLQVKEKAGFQTNRIVGVLSSHCHQDHRKYLHEYIEAGITCLQENTLVGICSKRSGISMVRLGEFVVRPFEVPHDVPCYGYQIEHPDMGKLVFVTDAKYVKYTFPEVNHIMVEANYAQDILDENMNNEVIPKSLRDRIMNSHMSFDTAKSMVEANKSPHLRNVIMCHLSSHNSDKKRFKEEMQEVAGPYCKVTVATKGVGIPLNKYPF
jgi:phosphoribosyl 1,2-cyclic phosphodiesterase